MSGFLFKLIRESAGLTQVQLAEQLGVDVASVQGWESGRRPLASLRVADLTRLRFQMLRCGARPILLPMLTDAIQADLIIGEAVQAGTQLVDPDGHPLGATVHQRKLSDMITWSFTGQAPESLQDFGTDRIRRGPVPVHPTLSEEKRERFFDHLAEIAETFTREDATLARRQAIYLLGFDTRTSTADWLRTEHSRALRDAGRTDDVPSWVAVRSSAVALSHSGDREPLRILLRHSLEHDRLEQANLNYWAYWVGEIDQVQVDDDFMNRIDHKGWSGVRPLEQLLELLHPGSVQAELNLHTVWALLLAQPTLLSNYPHLRSATAAMVEKLTEDRDLSPQARRELSDIAYAVRLAER
ncbi:MAG TPA: helix-turn-helix transcriptional regulator [Pseudonocardiaceae bacterium]|nr:helix-turn-helix transcriptional regulator [Pseudonocardiaceae bacterium]